MPAHTVTKAMPTDRAIARAALTVSGRNMTAMAATETAPSP
jgi:hypothetical protein